MFSKICSQKYTAMVILLNNGSLNLLENVFWFRARPEDQQLARNGVLKLGHPICWQHAEERTDEKRQNQMALMSCHSADEKLDLISIYLCKSDA